MKRFVFVLCLLASTAQAGEPRIVTFQTADATTDTISIVTPNASQLEKEELYELPITGLSEAEFLTASADIEPSKNVVLKLSMTLDKKPFMWFMAKQKAASGKYTVNIVTNRPHVRWQQELGYALTSAKLAPDVGADLLAELQSLADKAAAAHPTRTGTTVLEVIGPQPPPEPVEPDPVEPTPTPTPDKVNRVTYVYEKDEGPIPPAVARALQQLNSQGIVATEFEEDTTNGRGSTPEQYKVALAAARSVGLPAMVVQSATRVVRIVKHPTTTADVLENSK